MSPASRSASRAASQSGWLVAEGGREPGGEVVQVFAGVVEVHDRGGLGQDRGGQVPDPGCAVAEHDELADVVGAAAAGFGVHQGGELGGGGEAGQVAGGVRVAHRPALLVEGGLGEQGGEFDLAGAGAPIAALAGAAGDRGGHHGHPGAVDGDVELVRSFAAVGGAGSTDTLPARDRRGLGGERARSGRAVGFGGAFDALGGQPDSRQFGEQVGGGGERFGRGGARDHRAQPR